MDNQIPGTAVPPQMPAQPAPVPPQPAPVAPQPAPAAPQAGGFDPQDVQQNKLMAILAYFGILVIIPILAAKDSKFAKFHANQGLVLCICSIVLWVALSIISTLVYKFAFFLGMIISLLSFLVYIGIFVLAILGIVNAAKGEAKELPLIGKYQILK